MAITDAHISTTLATYLKRYPKEVTWCTRSCRGGQDRRGRLTSGNRTKHSRQGHLIVCERAHGRTRPSWSGTLRMAARAAQAIAAWARVERPSRFQWKMTW